MRSAKIRIGQELGNNYLTLPFRSFNLYTMLLKEEEYPRLSATLRYGALSEDSFNKPDIFPTTIASCNSGQKAGLAQSSSA
jgi:hypothetical protein